jgi:hypothetical protein
MPQTQNEKTLYNLAIMLDIWKWTSRTSESPQPLNVHTDRGHSFIGKTGGEIFHEMMLRQGVKHICELSLTSNQLTLLTPLFQSATLAAPFYPYSMPSTTRNISTSFSQNMSKVLDIWQRAMRGLVVYLVSFS